MDRQTIEEKVKQAIKKVLPRIRLDEIKVETRLKEDLKFDSLSAVELSLALEDAMEELGCKFEFSDEDLAQFDKRINTVEELVNYVAEQLSK